MTRYVALIDGEANGYGVVFPDLPGCAAMGDTVDQAIRHAMEALRDWVEVMEARGGEVPTPRPLEILRLDGDVQKALHSGAMLATVPLVRQARRATKANMSLDSGVLAAIDAAAARMGVNRSQMVELLAARNLGDIA